MKKTYFLISIVLIISVMMPSSVVLAEDNGVDDLRGRWDVEVTFEFESGDVSPPTPLILYINDLVEIPEMQGMVFAGGCMRSPDTDAFMPLSLAATPNPNTGTYERVTIYSTVIPDEGGPFVIRLAGEITVNGEGVPDDAAIGTVTTEFATGQWSGIHHDRRRTKCPSVGGFDLGVQADVYAHMDLAGVAPKYYTLYETHTIVVSSGMRVEAPDGTTMIVQEYTDIFSPDVDFIGRFRYLSHFEGMPLSGGIYNFVLLDILGNPIPGTESTDVWTGCPQDAPTNLMVDYEPMGDVALSWTAIDNIPGQFEPNLLEPENGIGFYQIGVSPFNWEGQNDYGSNGIQSPLHVIPWNSFEAGQPGFPDGWDYGQALSEFADGQYQVQAEAFSQPVPDSGGYGHECSVYNSAEQLLMSKQGNDLSFDHFSTISGQVVKQGTGELLEGILVVACEVDVYCSAERTDENGLYKIVVPPGVYRVGAYHETDYASEFYNEKTYWDEADDVLVNPGEDKSGIDFTLEPVGSISGAVEANGNPVVGVWVDACHESVPLNEWGQSPLCYGTPTNENGDYEILGILPGKYRLVIWGDEQYVAEFYDNVPSYDEATLVPVVGGQVAENRDFDLTAAGSISGSVMADGNSVVDVWVDACHESVPENEWGQSPLCYGAPTNENGYYEIHGITPGNYRVVTWGTEELGHEFYNEVQEYADATLVTVSPGQMYGGVNFTLEPMDQYHPVLHVVPAHPEIHGHDWNPDAYVTIYVDTDDDLENGWLYTESKFLNDEPTWCIAPCFDVSNVTELPDGILPGYVITMTDGDTIRVVHTTELVWNGVNMDAETVFGTAAPYSWVEVTSHGPEYAVRMVQADGSGYWEADFSLPGTEDFEQDILDLQPGYNGRSIQFEGGVPDDGTLAYWWIEEPPQPNVVAHPDHEWVSSYGWTVGDVVTLCIDYTMGGCGFTRTQTASPSSDPNDDSNIGDVWFDNWAPFDLTPGMFVTLQGGAYTRTLQVEVLSVDSFDDGADTVFGMAPAGREVGVGVHGPGIELWQVVTSGAGGVWSADFSSAEGIDFTLVEDIHAMIWDGDGDATQANYAFPSP